jgi:CRP-like cAMP-binding protein
LPTTDIATMHRNRLLATVHELELSRFTDILKLREYGLGEILSEPRARITEVVFPLDGVFSVVAETSDGDQVEAGTIGNEGVVGLAPFLGSETSMLRTMCQIPGTGLVADVGLLLARADGALATAARRYALSFMTMASQGAACNRLHSIEQRAARWLLMVNDRLDRNPFQLTHEFFAIMLGTTRPSVTLAAAALRKAGLISYERGKVTIVDRKGLEEAACECYDILTEEYERSTGAKLRASGNGVHPRPN